MTRGGVAYSAEAVEKGILTDPAQILGISYFIAEETRDSFRLSVKICGESKVDGKKHVSQVPAQIREL